MKLKETTVYVPISSSCPTIVIKETYGDIGARKETGYFHTKEELIELLGIVWDGCLKKQLFIISNMGDEWVGEIPKEKEQFIQSLFNTDEDEK